MQQTSPGTILASARRRKLLQLALAAGVAQLLPACGDSRNHAERDGALAPGDRFPDILLPNLDNRTAPFTSWPKVPLVVNFWASWCEPCRREMPGLEKLSHLFPVEKLRVVGISVDNDVNLAREFVLKYKLTFPMLSDSKMTLSSATLRIPAFPVTYLLKRDLTVAAIIAGERDWAASGALEEIGKLLEAGRL